MKNNKRLVCIASMSAIIIVSIGTTLAWFTDRDDLQSFFALGHIDIKLTEEEYEKLEDANGVYKEVLVPGDTLYKDIAVSLEEGSQSAYIRIKNPCVDINQTQEPILLFEEVQGENGIETTSVFGAQLQDGWVQKGAYFYYVKPIEVGENVYFLQEQQKENGEVYTIKIPETWNNTCANQNVNLEIEAEAIQSKNIEVDFASEDPWPKENITVYAQKVPTTEGG